jgi:NitT/TauT family transport system substrate-binding protein
LRESSGKELSAPGSIGRDIAGHKLEVDMRIASAVAAGMMFSAFMSGSSCAADKVALQLKWIPQAQFAGYFVAQAKGYYKDADLTVTINSGGPDVATPQMIAGGSADVVIAAMPLALAAREKGLPLVNISQTFKKSGLELTCRAETGIRQPADLKGRTVGVWFLGNEYPFMAWMSRLGIKTDGSSGGVKLLKQGLNVDPLIRKQADCISTMSYNEYWSVIDAGYKPNQLVVFNYDDEGVDTLEDGLYVLENRLADGAFVSRMARFVQASMKGWNYARKNIDEAVRVVLAADTTGTLTQRHQRRMLEEIVKLLDAGDGELDPADYERTVSVLLSGGSDPVITKRPVGAWTHKIYDAMK